jgi:hypothetical protein
LKWDNKEKNPIFQQKKHSSPAEAKDQKVVGKNLKSTEEQFLV